MLLLPGWLHRQLDLLLLEGNKAQCPHRLQHTLPLTAALQPLSCAAPASPWALGPLPLVYTALRVHQTFIKGMTWGFLALFYI